MRAVLYSEIARAYFPAPKVNYVRVVINGESWGVYVNAQQFNKDFLRDYFKTDRARAGRCRAARAAAAAWSTWATIPPPTSGSTRSRRRTTRRPGPTLIRLFKVLNETPPDKLEAALRRCSTSTAR